MDKEIWKPLVYRGEYFGDTHEISNMGRLKNIVLNKILHPNVNRQGYLMQVISRGRARSIAIKIHRAVAENFVRGDCHLQVNHKDLNKLNNRFDNLEFVTTQENTRHAVENRAMEQKLKREDLDCVWQMKQSGIPTKEIAKVFGVDVSTLNYFFRGNTHKWYYEKHPELLSFKKTWRR